MHFEPIIFNSHWNDSDMEFVPTKTCNFDHLIALFAFFWHDTLAKDDAREIAPKMLVAQMSTVTERQRESKLITAFRVAASSPLLWSLPFIVYSGRKMLNWKTETQIHRFVSSCVTIFFVLLKTEEKTNLRINESYTFCDTRKSFVKCKRLKYIRIWGTGKRKIHETQNDSSNFQNKNRTDASLLSSVGKVAMRISLFSCSKRTTNNK